MSKMSQLHAELTEQAHELGFVSIEEAEANGYAIDYEARKLVKNEDLVNKAYDDLTKTERKQIEAKQVEMVYRAIMNAKDMIELIYRKEGEACTHVLDDITDETIKDYYFTLNEMCCDLADRGVMMWQKED